MKILLHGLNYSPEEIGIGKYSGEMAEELAGLGCQVTVVTTPPYYPHWKVAEGFHAWRYASQMQYVERSSAAPREPHLLGTQTGQEARQRLVGVATGADGFGNSAHRLEAEGWSAAAQSEIASSRTAPAEEDESLSRSGHWLGTVPHRTPEGQLAPSPFPPSGGYAGGVGDSNIHRRDSVANDSLPIRVIRCPLWVPRQVNGWKRIIHLASFGMSSVPPVLWQAIRYRPDVILTIEPAAFCMPTTLLAARLCGAKSWLHVQDFEVDAAFELGILKQPWMKRLVLSIEAKLMRSFDRVSSISPSMVQRLQTKNVPAARVRLFPNWVDCQTMRPLQNAAEVRDQFDLPRQACIALYAGNIGKKQGLEIVVEAAEKSRLRDDLLFVICGDGAARKEIQHRAKDLPNVRFLPVQPSERFNALMNCADIHLLPQRADAADLVMPSKLTGMLATGRPVVASAHHGTQIADVVFGKGLVVPPGNASAFRNAVQELADDRAQRMQLGKAGREYAVEELSRPSVLSRFHQELTALAAQAKGTETSLCIGMAWLWSLITVSIAAYSLLKPSTSASDLPFVPTWWAIWLDENYDLRTFLMSLAICIMPAWLLSSSNRDKLRRRLLLAILITLVAFEFAQLWIPTRGFGWPDIAYTLSGVGLAELLVVMLQACRRLGRREAAIS